MKKKIILASLLTLLIFIIGIFLYFTGWRPTQYFRDDKYMCGGYAPSCPVGFKCVGEALAKDGEGKCVRVNDLCGGLEDSECPEGYECKKKYDSGYEVGKCVKK